MEQQVLRHGRSLAKCRLILPIFYTDGFGHTGTRESSIDGIYMTLGNLSKADHLRAFTKQVLCYVPHGANLLEALQIVVVEPMMRLERGIKLFIRALKKEVWCYGSLYAMLGDHPSQAKLAGTTRSFFTFLH
jgi:hypothetical protein